MKYCWAVIIVTCKDEKLIMLNIKKYKKSTLLLQRILFCGVNKKFVVNGSFCKISFFLNIPIIIPYFTQLFSEVNFHEIFYDVVYGNSQRFGIGDYFKYYELII